MAYNYEINLRVGSRRVMSAPEVDLFEGLFDEVVEADENVEIVWSGVNKGRKKQRRQAEAEYAEALKERRQLLGNVQDELMEMEGLPPAHRNIAMALTDEGVRLEVDSRVGLANIGVQ